MRILRYDGVFLIQFESADKGFLQLGKEMERTSEKSDVAADRLSAGKAGDRLIDYRLENGRGKIFLGRALVDQRLDIRLGKYAAARRDGIKSFVILRVFVQTGSVRLQKRGHLVDKGTCSSGTDTVHTLFDIAALKIDDLGVLAAQLDRHVGLGRGFLESGGYCDNFLNKRNLQMVGKSKPAGSGDHRMESDFPQSVVCFLEKISQSFLDIGEMSLIVGEQKIFIFIKNRDLYGGGSDVNSQCVCTHKK